MLQAFNLRSVLCLILSIGSTVGQDEGYCKAKIDKNEECGEHSFEIIRPMLDYFNELNIEKKFTTKKLFDLQRELNSTKLKLKEITEKYDEKTIKYQLLSDESANFKSAYEECKAGKMHKTNSQINGGASSCAESVNYSGGLQMQLPGVNDFRVACDAKVNGSGWTVIQRRYNGLVNFNLMWKEYKAGFGNVDEEHFIGLERLHLLTKSQRYELYIQLTDQSNDIRFARYDNFVVESENEGYKLSSLGQYTGNAEDSFSAHVGNKFSTKDRDNDMDSNRNCAKVLQGGWWFFDCAHCNLNGKTFHCRIPEENEKIETHGCIYWQRWHGRGQSLSRVQMMIRPWGYKE